ncbi:hypothetical protein [Aliikangiella coralliicola]|uniref:Secreted protein n=1 Tax=Aliikangiella coralliicola TaxID=2592383 RepID=A0A545U5U3_9GAMM|nr:hypothetical protein [Aliikangiella coralliicola]TQV84845.1 hypothetical protein FLL46_20820 [Aliikangiella coralliicola]
MKILANSKKAVLVTTLISLTSFAAYAAVFQKHTYTYYSDSSKTTEIGTEVTSCKNNGRNILDGERSPYYTVKSEKCTDTDLDTDCFYQDPWGRPYCE